MTVVTMVWVQEHVHEVRNATKAVLSYLAFRAHYDDGTAAWPAMETIAGACGLSEKTVQRSIDQLLDLGLIEPGEQNFSAVNPKTGKPVRANRQTVVWNVICKESNLPTEPYEDRNASKVRAAMRRAEWTKAKRDGRDGGRTDKMSEASNVEQTEAKMSPLENGGNRPVPPDSDKMSPLGAQGGRDDGNEDKMSENPDKMSPNNTMKYNYPSLPTGELPASGKRPGMDDGRNGTGEVFSEAAAVEERLTAVRSGLSLTTIGPTKRDHSKIANLINRAAKANGGDHAAALALILAVVDWLPSNAFWLSRVDSVRRLANDWDRIVNDWTIGQLERRRALDTEARDRDRRREAEPTPIPERHSGRHVHSLICEHVLADMRPHEAEYDHEGSLRRGNPSEWQTACMRRADELNRRDGIDAG